LQTPHPCAVTVCPAYHYPACLQLGVPLLPLFARHTDGPSRVTEHMSEMSVHQGRKQTSTLTTGEHSLMADMQDRQASGAQQGATGASPQQPNSTSNSSSCGHKSCCHTSHHTRAAQARKLKSVATQIPTLCLVGPVHSASRQLLQLRQTSDNRVHAV
jgi:hypothetical protein